MANGGKGDEPANIPEVKFSWALTCEEDELSGDFDMAYVLLIQGRNTEKMGKKRVFDSRSKLAEAVHGVVAQGYSITFSGAMYKPDVEKLGMGLVDKNVKIVTSEDELRTLTRDTRLKVWCAEEL
jgi:hypothetical protein